MNILQMQFLDVSVKVGRTSVGEEASGEKEERGGVEGEVCDSVTPNVQLNVNCQMIS